MSLTKKSFGLIAGMMLVLLAFSFIFTATPVSAEVADAVESANHMTFSVNAAGEGVIDKYNYVAPEGDNPGTPVEITIPNTAVVNGQTVTIKHIKYDAFRGCNLTKVVFDPNSAITTIGQSAFYGNPLSGGIGPFPRNLESLGGFCFYGCTQLKSLDFRGLENLTAIPAQICNGCDSLRTVELDEGITSIGLNAFHVCPIARLTLPSSVSSVGFGAFQNTRILDISNKAPGTLDISYCWWDVYKNMEVIWSEAESNVNDTTTCLLFNTTTQMICGLKKNPEQYDDWNNGNITIPNTLSSKKVKGFSSSAFNNKYSVNVKSISFQNSGYEIESIAPGAFGGFPNATSIGKLPEGIKTIGENAFIGFGCNASAPTTLTLPASITTLSSGVFALANFDTVNFPGDKVKSIHKDVSGNVAGVTNQIIKTVNFEAIPKTNASGQPSIAGAPWGMQYARINWANNQSDNPQVVIIKDAGGNPEWEFNLTTKTLLYYLKTTTAEDTLTVPGQITYGGNTFEVKGLGLSTNKVLKTPLKKLIISEGIEKINDQAFRSLQIREVVLPNSLKTIQYAVFSGNKLTSITLPIGINEISSSAFSDNNFVGTIEIPGNITKIEPSAFIRNPGITAFYIRQYRYQDTDDGFAQSGYVPPVTNAAGEVVSNGVYRLAPAAVQGAAPFGAYGAKVFYMDLPRVNEPTFTVTPNPRNNTVNLTANVKTNANNVYVRSITAPLKNQNEETLNPKMPAVTLPSLETGTPKTKASTGTMSISGADRNGVKGGNGTYYFAVTYGTNTGFEDTVIFPYELDAFHTLTYNMGDGKYYVNNEEQTSFVAGTYVKTSNVAALAPIVSDTIAPEGKQFKEWNTRSNGSGDIIKPGQNVTINGNTTLYAIWENIPEDNFGGGDDGLSGDGKADNTQILVQYLAPSGNGTVTSTPKFKVINDLVADSTNNTVTTTAATATANSGYAFDNWSNNINSSVNGTGAFTFNNVKAGTKIEIIANFAEDIIGGAIGGGDQIPDKYQVQVTYRAGANGKLSGANLEGVITEVKSAAKVNGLYANTVSFTGQNITPVANSGYALNYWQTNRNNDKSNTSAIQFTDVPVGDKVVVQAAFISTAAKSVEETIISDVPADPADVTLDDEEAINNALAEYEGLSDEQKAEIDPEIHNRLNDAIDALNELKDQKAADEVATQINDTVPAAGDVTVADEEAILAAKAAYDALTPAQQAKVDPEVKQKLDDAVAALQNAKDQAAADVVADQITALPAVADFDPTNAEQAQAVADAKNAYDALTDAQKAKVPQEVKDKLNGCIEKIAAVDQAAADEVIALINDLPAVDKLRASHAALVDEAAAAYEALTDAQKILVPQEAKDKLTAAVDKIFDLTADNATKAVKEEIDNLPDPANVTTDDIAAIEQALEAYEALNDDQKTQLPQETKDKIDALKDKVDEVKADAVEGQINNLPAADAITADDADAINAAKDAYDALTDEQKAKVDPEVKAKLDAAVDAIDQVKADAVEGQIDALPAVDAMTLDDEAAVVAAREAYDALTDAQKAKVSADTLAALEAAEAKIAELKGDTPGGDDIDVTKIDNKAGSGTTITSNGNVLTVAGNDACFVAYKDGDNYVKVPAVKNGDKYDFTIPAGVAAADISVVKKGDVNLNGRIDSQDNLWIKQQMRDAREFNQLQLWAGDVNNNGRLDSQDNLWIKQQMRDARDFTW